MFLVITVINGIVSVSLLVPQWCSFPNWEPKSTPIVFSSEEGHAAPGGSNRHNLFCLPGVKVNGRRPDGQMDLRRGGRAKT